MWREHGLLKENAPGSIQRRHFVCWPETADTHGHAGKAFVSVRIRCKVILNYQDNLSFF
jgi:hypothetical protein